MSHTQYSTFKRRASERKLGVKITLEQFHSLRNGVCYYCGVKPEMVAIYCHKLQIKTPYMTIDRKDNSIGYLLENCVSCCFVCNRTKSNFFSAEEMKAIGEKFIRPKWDSYKDEAWEIYLQNVQDGVYE